MAPKQTSFKLDYEALRGIANKDISETALPKDTDRKPKIHKCWHISKS